jgi:putative ABC transport system permease protein
MRGFIDEIKSAVAGLAKAPAFTALAVGVLGLGLGAVIFMYGVADTLMLKPAPYPTGDRLYTIVTIGAQAPDDYDDQMILEDYLLVREQQTQFDVMGAAYVGTAYLTGDGQAERYDGGFTDGYMFDVAGVAPQLGRAILPRDATDGAAPVVVLGHQLWKERFDSDPSVIGRIVRVNGKASEIIGVMPEGYAFPSAAQLWVPIQERPGSLSRDLAASVAVYGVLKHGGSPDLAQQELAPVAAEIKSKVPKQLFDGHFEVMPFAASFIGDDDKLIWTMLVAVACVMLIACANVSNLLLARSAYRVRETTVRSALGASRSRLVLHVLAEGLVISTLATLFGLLLASIALDVFRIAMDELQDGSPHWWTYEIDFRVAAVSVGLALLSTLIAGLPAALRASRPSLDSLLRDGGRTGTGLAIGRIAWGLVVFEVALACLLLGTSALMTKGVLKATQADIGVETSDIMTARVGLTAGTMPEQAEQIRFWETFLARIEAQPGIQAATVADSLPGLRSGDGPYAIEGREYGEGAARPSARTVSTSASYFETFRLAALQGRLFDSRDGVDSMQVAVVNETMAKEVWPDSSPIGSRILIEFEADAGYRTVIGIVPDVVHDDDGTVEATVYTSISQWPERFMSIAVRGDGDPRGLANAVRTALAETSPDLALYWVQTLDEARAIQTSGYRIIGTIFGVFAVVALVLAAAGLFGVLAFHVGQRTREIGVRRALGAPDGKILRMVMRASGAQILIGIVIGMGLLPLMGRALGDILNDSPYDPAIYSAVLVIMLVIAVGATLTPTRRALKVDPAAALRYE